MSKDNQNNSGNKQRAINPLALSLAIILLIASVVFFVVVLIGPATTPENPLPTTLPPAPTNVPPTVVAPIANTPAPTEIPAPPAGVRRIAIARFDGTVGADEIDLSIEGSLLAVIASEGLTSTIEVVRVQELATSSAEAHALLQHHKADMLIWGRVDENSVRAQTAFAASGMPDLQRVLAAPMPLTVLFPPEMEFYLSRELGTDMAFLSLVALGQIHLAAGEFDAAHEQIQSALLTMPAALPREARERGVAIVNFYNGLNPDVDNDTLAQLQTYSQVLRLYDGFASARNNRGTIYFAAGDYEAALADFQSALDGSLPDEQLPATLINRSLARYALGEIGGALADATHAVNQAADDARSHNMRGLLRYKLGDFESALEDFSRATELAPQSAGAQFNLAATLDVLGEGEQAIAAYNLLLERYPQDALALAYRGDAYLHQGLSAEAATSYDEALKHDLTLVYAYQRRASYYIERGNFDVALSDLRAALATGQQDALTYALLGDVFAAQQELAAAEDAYNDALALQPDLIAALAGRGSVRRVQRIFINGLSDLESALEFGGPTPTLQLDLGLVYYELGRFADAQQAFEYVIANDEQPAAGHAGLALALDSQLQREAAEEALLDAVQLDGRFSDLDYLRDKLLWSFNARRRIDSILVRMEAS